MRLTDKRHPPYPVSLDIKDDRLGAFLLPTESSMSMPASEGYIAHTYLIDFAEAAWFQEA